MSRSRGRRWLALVGAGFLCVALVAGLAGGAEAQQKSAPLEEVRLKKN